MKKIFQKMICVTLTALTVFSCFACKNEDNSDAPEPTVAANAENHQFNYTETDKWLLKNGSTDYVIVTPTLASTEVNYAKEELIRYFKEATGVTLKTLTDANLTHKAENKYISLGDTTLFETSGLTVDKSALTEDGVRIMTKDQTIFFQGGSGKGVLYAAYDFLNIHFNFDTFTKEHYSLDTGVKDIKLMNYDVTDIPDIPIRARGGPLYAATTDTDEVMYSYRLRTTDAYWKRSLPIYPGTDKTGGAADHNSLEYLPPETYGAQYPEFYSSKNSVGQLCYTARGDAEKFEIMTTLCAEKIEQSLRYFPREQYPNYTAVQLGIEDNYDMCECDACMAAIDKYGAISSTIIIFLNEVGQKVNAWMELPENEPYKRENFQYMFFAYMGTLKPPYYWNEETQQYEAADDKVMPAEGVNIVPFCAFNTFDHGKSLYDDSNAQVYEWAEIWGEFFPGAWSWSYGCFFRDYFCFFDSYNYFADFYAFLYEKNFRFTLVQHHSAQRGGDAAFFTLNAYITSKLSWNSALNMDDLIENYMKTVYKDAAPYMLAAFNESRNWFSRTHTEQNWGATVNGFNPTSDSKYWDIGFVNTMFGILDKAYAAIEPYKRDTATYEKLKRYIDLEWLFPAKVAISNFEKEFTTEEFAAIKIKFKDTCNAFAMVAYNEFEDLDSFLSTF